MAQQQQGQDELYYDLAHTFYRSQLKNISIIYMICSDKRARKVKGERQEELYHDLSCAFHHSQLEKKSILNMIYTGKQDPKEKIGKRYVKKYFRSHIKEELIAAVCHPKNYDKFEALGFFD